MTDLAKKVGEAIIKAATAPPHEAIKGTAKLSWIDPAYLGRAAIEAMREPTEAMIAAADRQRDVNKTHPRGYIDGTYFILRAAIDAALTSSPQEKRSPPDE